MSYWDTTAGQDALAARHNDRVILNEARTTPATRPMKAVITLELNVGWVDHPREAPDILRDAIENEVRIAILNSLRHHGLIRTARIATQIHSVLRPNETNR